MGVDSKSVDTEDGLRDLINRLSRFFRRTTNQGVGPLLTFAISAMALAVVFRLLAAMYLHDEDDVGAVVGTEVLVTTEQSKGAALAVVTNGIWNSGVADRLLCGRDSGGDCAAAWWLRDTTQNLLQLARSEPGVKAEPADNGLREAVDRSRASRRQDAVSVALSPSACGTPGRVRDNEELSERFNVEPPECTVYPDGQTITIVPPIAVQLKSELSKKRTRGAIEDASLFADIVSQMPRYLNKRANDRSRLVGAYLVSIDSTISYWSRDGVHPQELPQFRFWAARPTFVPFLNEAASLQIYMSPPYLDLGGHGIVRSTCYPIETELEAMKQPIVLSVLCVDFALDLTGVSEVNRTLDDSALSDSCILSVSKGDRPRWKEESGGDGYSSCHLLADTAVKEFLNDHASDVVSERVQRQGIVHVSEGGEPVFLVPLGSFVDPTQYALLIKVYGYGVKGTRFGWVLLAGFLLCVLVASGFRGALSSRRAAELEAIIGHLRSLQIGVFQTDGHDVITAANDRAEEIVGKTLPNFGMSQPPQEFWSIFNLNFVREEVPTAQIGEQISPGFRVSRPEDIRRARQGGRVTSYYVKLLIPFKAIIRRQWFVRERNDLGYDSPVLEVTKEAESVVIVSWVRITAGPILIWRELSGGQAGVHQTTRSINLIDGTFGTIEPCIEKTLVDSLNDSIATPEVLLSLNRADKGRP
jgi:PAS domain-containing protein